MWHCCVHTFSCMEFLFISLLVIPFMDRDGNTLCTLRQRVRGIKLMWRKKSKRVMSVLAWIGAPSLTNIKYVWWLVLAFVLWRTSWNVDLNWKEKKVANALDREDSDRSNPSNACKWRISDDVMVTLLIDVPTKGYCLFSTSICLWHRLTRYTHRVPWTAVPKKLAIFHMN